MKRLHNTLCVQSKSYARWHEHPHRNHHHWMVAIVVFAVGVFAIANTWVVLTNEQGFLVDQMIVRAQPLPTCTQTTVNGFTHPGLLSTCDDLNFMRDRLLAGDEPWTSAYNVLRQDALSNNDAGFVPNPPATYGTADNAVYKTQENELSNGGKAVYRNAIRYYMTGDTVLADKAVEILMAWTHGYNGSDTSVQGGNALLTMSDNWPKYMWGAEILRATYPGWTAQDQADFKSFLNSKIVPNLQSSDSFANGNCAACSAGSWSNTYTDNWASWGTHARLTIAVFSDDQALYTRAQNEYTYLIGTYIRNDFTTNETCRPDTDDLGNNVNGDLWHTQLGTGPHVASAEVAWNQGDNWYGLQNNRLLNMLERHAPYVCFDARGSDATWPCGSDLSLLKTDAFGLWEMAYNHYHKRQGLATPGIEAVIAEVNRAPEGLWPMMGYGTFTHNRYINGSPDGISASGIGNKCAGVVTPSNKPPFAPVLSHAGKTPGQSGASLPPANFKVAFIGDQGLGSSYGSDRGNNPDVLRLIKSEGADLVVHSGDFGYDEADPNSPVEWKAQIDDILNSSIPYLSVIGNHDEANWNGTNGYGALIQQQVAAAEAKGAICSGTPGLNYACEYNGVYFVFSGSTSTHTTNSTFVDQQLSADNHEWQVCAWHYNQTDMQPGSKSNEAGWAGYQQCAKHGAIVITAHEHSYGRTKILTNIGSGSHGPTGQSDVLSLSPGRTFVAVSGLGGASKRDYDCNAHASNTWWASIFTQNYWLENGTERAKNCTTHVDPADSTSDWSQVVNNYNYGALFIEFNVDGDPYKARGYFKTINGNVIDQFTILLP